MRVGIRPVVRVVNVHVAISAKLCFVSPEYISEKIGVFIRFNKGPIAKLQALLKVTLAEVLMQRYVIRMELVLSQDFPYRKDAASGIFDISDADFGVRSHVG